MRKENAIESFSRGSALTSRKIKVMGQITPSVLHAVNAWENLRRRKSAVERHGLDNAELGILC